MTLDGIIESMAEGHRLAGRKVRPDYVERGRAIYQWGCPTWAKLDEFEQVHQTVKVMWKGIRA